jgi:acetoin utilization deacetylase AcuC-like enzyme
MRVSYTSKYYADIGDAHVFPIRKFELVRDTLLAEGTLSAEELFEPAPVTPEQLHLVHTEDYVRRFTAGTLTDREIRRLGLPWSKTLVRRSFLATGGTIAAARFALRDGVGSNLAGGTHHAFPDRGEGFCVFNDVAVAIRVLQLEGEIGTAAIVDCDVHQGNGTAEIFAGDDTVYTLSLHGEKNYPLHKARSSCDVELPDGTTDSEYLEALAHHLPPVFERRPSLIFYLAGADPFIGDKLGRLDLSIDGLRKRDEAVIAYAVAVGVPIVTVMSGGYAADIRDTVEIHCNTIRVAKGWWRNRFQSAAC